MMFILRMLMRRGSGRSMDPLQVAMTGVRMGERFLQIGCHDKALLAGLASKVGLSGASVVAASNERQAHLAESIARKVGALIEIKNIEEGRQWPFDADTFDLIVVDDTDDGFWGFEPPGDILAKALTSVRRGGRIEVVTPVNSQHGKFDFVTLLSEAGFKPVRVLAESNGLRFVEGLRPNL